ncbi:MAG: DUF2341 domain-containing protein, partial [Planctomycetes bacterium]|nr:DUF2341 domain-containing protein [Planctomycetota bacterium]
MDSISIANNYLVITPVHTELETPVLYHQNPDDTIALAQNITIPADSTLTISPYHNWQHKHKITLNTTSSGANINQSVSDFPLLVRLQSQSLSQSQSKSIFEDSHPKGTDIRLSKSNGAPLPYEIEQWDMAAGKAAIWVKIDTIHPNNNTQYIYLYTGNPSLRVSEPEASASRSHGLESGPAVFDTTNGFTGVWHMNNKPEQDASLLDATTNTHHGSFDTVMAAENLVEGIVGEALMFDGKDDDIKLPVASGLIP